MTQDNTPSTTPFEELELSPTTLEALSKAGYLAPTPVQAGLIPRALASEDVIAQARTGTGKTAAFGIPLLEILKGHQAKGPRAIVLVPTRELAVQVRDEIVKLSHGRRIQCIATYGGKPIRGQIEKLRKGADIVVGTPGRVLDHLARRTLDLSGIQIVVLDEADRMLDIGFRPDIEKILRRCPQSRQTLLLSATVPPPVMRLAQRYMHEPVSLDFSPTDLAGETIDQYYFTVDPDRKFSLLEKLLEREQPKQAIVFCRTKRGTERIGRRLEKRRARVAWIHGDMQQTARDRVMRQFRAGEIQILVATDVVGRGIDVSGISHIINFDIPAFCDDYVHRVGRTGRMGREGIAEGVAYTLVTPEEGGELTRIEMRINRQLQRDEIPGFETTETLSVATLAPADATGQTDEEPGQAKPPAKTPPGKKKKKKYRRAL